MEASPRLVLGLPQRPCPADVGHANNVLFGGVSKSLVLNKAAVRAVGLARDQVVHPVKRDKERQYIRHLSECWKQSGHEGAVCDVETPGVRV